MTKLFAIIKFHWLHELSNKYYMYKHNIQHHCYKACMTNCYPVEPLPFFSPSLHKFTENFTPPSEQKMRLAHWVLCAMPQI